MSQCDKIEYQTAKSAREALKAITLRDKDKMKYYKCPVCGFYHLATSRRKKIREESVAMGGQKDASYFRLGDVVINPKKMDQVLKKQENLGYATEKVFASLLGQIFYGKQKKSGNKPD